MKNGITTSLSPDIVDMFRVVNKTFNEKVVIDSRHQKLKMIRGDKKYGI